MRSIAARNTVDAPETTANGSYPQTSREALPVSDVGRLLLRCADRPGLVAAVTTFLARAGANIVSLDQHSTEQSGGTFLQRTIFHLRGLAAARDEMERDFAQQVAARFNMHFGLTEAAKPKRVAIMASRDDHCLLDLLWRNRRGELDMSVVIVIANHPDLADQVRAFGVPFLHVPTTKDIRAQAEQRQLDVLRGNVDVVVLARYAMGTSKRPVRVDVTPAMPSARPAESAVLGYRCSRSCQPTRTCRRTPPATLCVTKSSS